MTDFISILAVLAAYLLGSLSSAVIISKKLTGSDIRSSGSGNAGATNMLRIHGKKYGVLTLIFDALKGVLAVLIGMAANYAIDVLCPGNSFILHGNLHFVTGVFAVIGHVFPVFFGFKGGKGVATSLGVILMLNWQIGLIIAASAIIIMALSGYVSLGSIIGGILYPVSVLVFMVAEKNVNYVSLACAVVLGVTVILKHRTNIQRLLSGTENKLKIKK